MNAIMYGVMKQTSTKPPAPAVPDLVQLLKEVRSTLRELRKIEKARKALGSVHIRGKAKRRKPKVSAAQRARRTKTRAAKAGK
jgi:hypothetical protein